jgi:steroid delta-isomerase-like uncharacterized protein
MSLEQNKALSRRFFDEVCNGRQQAVADELFTADHQYHDPASPGTPAGPAGMKQLTSTYYTAFRDARWTVNEVIAVDDTVVTRWTGTGTQTAELMGIPPTNRRVSVDGIWVHRVRNGRIAESWNVWDALGMLQQLGVVPQVVAR